MPACLEQTPKVTSASFSSEAIAGWLDGWVFDWVGGRLAEWFDGWRVVWLIECLEGWLVYWIVSLTD